MLLIQIFVIIIAILLIVNIILTIKAGKKDSRNELTEIKSFIETLTFILKDSEFITKRKGKSETATALRTEIGIQHN